MDSCTNEMNEVSIQYIPVRLGLPTFKTTGPPRMAQAIESLTPPTATAGSNIELAQPRSRPCARGVVGQRTRRSQVDEAAEPNQMARFKGQDAAIGIFDQLTFTHRPRFGSVHYLEHDVQGRVQGLMCGRPVSLRHCV